jgi:AraC-like DNA-binding protein
LSRLVAGDVLVRLARARERIDDEYAEPLALDALARTAGMSPYHFLRQFQRVFGTTPHAYLASVRIARAQLLLARQTTVTDACLRVGYLSLGSFSSRFQREVGCSPIAWQRRVRRLVPVPAGLARLKIPCCYLYFWNRNFRETAPAPA